MAVDLWRTRPFMSYPAARVVDRLFEHAFAPFFAGRDGGADSSGQTGVQTLPVTIWETGDALHAALMAPGLDESALTVTVQDDTLSVEGELKFQPPEGARMIWQEFGPARFRRSLRFGSPVNPDRAEAVYRNGLLLITMPKSQEARPRQVRVQASTNEHEQTMSTPANAPAADGSQPQVPDQPLPPTP
jgi:HSP20 family protein